MEENNYTREVFELVINWCKPYGILRTATDFAKDVRDLGAIVVLVEKEDDTENKCLAYLDEVDRPAWVIVTANVEDYVEVKESYGLFEVEV